MKHSYTFVKRARDWQIIQMQQIVDSYNELAPEHYDILGIQLKYKLERAGHAWVMVSCIDKVHTECADYGILKENDFFDSMSFVRCSKCGAIRTLTSGQVEFCLECDTNW